MKALTELVVEYLAAHDEYKAATSPPNSHAQPRQLSYADPRILRYREARSALDACLAAPQPAEAVAALIVKDVAELPDRNSPEGWPEAMIVTGEELTMIVTERLRAALTAAGGAGPIVDRVSQSKIDQLNTMTETLLAIDARRTARIAEQEAAQPAAAVPDRAALIELLYADGAAATETGITMLAEKIIALAAAPLPGGRTTINVGTIGHVSRDKGTLTAALTKIGQMTQPEGGECPKCGAKDDDEAGRVCIPDGDDCPGTKIWPAPAGRGDAVAYVDSGALAVFLNGPAYNGESFPITMRHQQAVGDVPLFAAPVADAEALAMVDAIAHRHSSNLNNQRARTQAERDYWASQWQMLASDALAVARRLTGAIAPEGFKPFDAGAVGVWLALPNPVTDDAAKDLADWLADEMPPGTVIGDPRWWAAHIVKRLNGAGS